MKDTDNFLSFTELKERYDIKTNFLVYHGLVSCIKSLRNAIENENEKATEFSALFVENFIKAPKPNRLAYKKLVSAKQSSPRKSQEKRSADCSLQRSKTIDWEMAYKLPFCSTKDTKLIIFQFKLLHRRLATNDFLNKIGIRDDDICTFCRTEKETLSHLFWSCCETSCFWQGFMKWLAENQIKIKIRHFHSRYNNWPKVGHLIQHKPVLLLPCCQILHMVLQIKGNTPKNRKVSWFPIFFSTFWFLNLKLNK